MKIGQIEKNVEPTPDHWRRKYPFNDMEVDDSILIEGTKEDVHKACLAVHSYGKRNEKKFRYRKSDTLLSVRIYRIS